MVSKSRLGLEDFGRDSSSVKQPANFFFMETLTPCCCGRRKLLQNFIKLCLPVCRMNRLCSYLLEILDEILLTNLAKICIKLEVAYSSSKI